MRLLAEFVSLLLAGAACAFVGLFIMAMFGIGA